MSVENGHGRNQSEIIVSFLLVFSPLYTVQLNLIYNLFIEGVLQNRSP